MVFELIYSRADGSFVGIVNGSPYHIVNDPDLCPADLWRAASEWVDKNGAPPPEPEISPVVSVPEVISDRQFFQALALEGTITQAEALDAVKTGTIPAALRTFLGGLSGADAFNAEMLLSGAVEFHRSHPLTVGIGSAQGMSPSEIDNFFRFAASL